MWIPFAIVGFFIALITAILLLPVKLILKNDENNVLILQYRLLGKTFDIEAGSEENPITKALKSACGLERLDKEKLETDLQSKGLKQTISESYAMITDLLKEVLALLKKATVTRLHITIRCTGDGPDSAAIHYGECCAVTYGLLNVLRRFLKIRKRGCKLDIGCDFFGEKPVFRYEVILRIRVVYILGALWRIVLAEAKRMGQKEQNQQK